MKLTDEVVDVWRPVQALRLGPTTFQLVDQIIPDDEEWEFQPGERVVVAPAMGDHGRPYLRAVRVEAPVGVAAE